MITLLCLMRVELKADFLLISAGDSGIVQNHNGSLQIAIMLEFRKCNGVHNVKVLIVIKFWNQCMHVCMWMQCEKHVKNQNLSKIVCMGSFSTSIVCLHLQLQTWVLHFRGCETFIEIGRYKWRYLWFFLGANCLHFSSFWNQEYVISEASCGVHT